MVRWQPGAQARLQAATVELVAEQGFEQTTVAEIASRAGLTERTFFRYFADKREVLFAGQAEFERLFVDGIGGAPRDIDSFAVVTAAVDTAAAAFFPPDRQPYARKRQEIIDANPGLQERELLKLSGLTAAMSLALQQRGTPEPTAVLAAECGVLVFRVAFARWTAGTGAGDLVTVLADVRGELAALTGTGTSVRSWTAASPS